MGDVETNVFMAKLAEQAERYDEMITHMKRVVVENQVLDLEQRNLLSVAYKNVVGARRASLRIISSIKQKEVLKDPNGPTIGWIKEYSKNVETELSNLCEDILNLLDETLIAYLDQNSDEPNIAEQKVFYNKMKADYYRYLAEFKDGDDKLDVATKANESYKAATENATSSMAPTHPIRLGLALNYSVFLYEVEKKEDEACKLAKDAFDSAIAELDTLDEESYKDSTLIMQLLRDNLTLWTSTEDDRS